MAKRGSQHGNLGPTTSPSPRAHGGTGNGGGNRSGNLGASVPRASRAAASASTPRGKRMATSTNAEGTLRHPSSKGLKGFGGAPIITGGVAHGERGAAVKRSATGVMRPPVFGGGKIGPAQPRPRGSGIY